MLSYAIGYTFLLLSVGLVSQTCGLDTAGSGGQLQLPLQPIPAKACVAIQDIPTQGINLTAKEKDALSDICWTPQLEVQQPWKGFKGTAGRGIPPGVKCNITQWCDAQEICTDICERGTVVIDQWLSFAIQTQLKLARRLPLCYATLPGTHNSGITLADGYGNLDEQFQAYFQWIKWIAGDAPLRTNDHWISLTDQLNLGVRALELDTHWVEGILRIAHCGGYHSVFDRLVTALNVVAKLLGHPIHWDTETVGCNPSMSSIPVTEQRSFVDALREIRSWMDLPEHAHEFLVLYLDDQIDLSLWGVLDHLKADMLSVFDVSEIITPPEHQQHPQGVWPSIDNMSAAGKRVMFVSSTTYAEPIASLVFSRNTAGPGGVCDWSEPPLGLFQGPPECLALPGSAATLQGRLYRIGSCEIMYGPLNCDMVWRPDNAPVLDVDTTPGVAACGLNMPSPDMLTPERAAASIWTWAPGHPFAPGAPAGLGTNASVWEQPLQRLWQFVGQQSGVAAVQCAEVSAQDGRWRAGDCAAAGGRGSACRAGAWQQQKWQVAAGQRGVCPEGSQWSLPAHARDNAALQAAVQAAGLQAAWLPLSGPSWELADSAASDQK